MLREGVSKSPTTPAIRAALAADPNNVSVLYFLAGNNMPSPDKAIEHAQKALTLPKPATMQDAQFQTMQARLHGIVGASYFSQQKYREAQEHYAAAVKADPKDHTAQFRLGFAAMNLMGDAAKSAQAANNDLIRAMTSLSASTSLYHSLNCCAASSHSTFG